jgi:hypothetical protein
MYGSLAIVGFVAGIIFYLLFGRASLVPVPVLESVETSPSWRVDEEAPTSAGKNVVILGKDKFSNS